MNIGGNLLLGLRRYLRDAQHHWRRNGFGNRRATGLARAPSVATAAPARINISGAGSQLVVAGVGGQNTQGLDGLGGLSSSARQGNGGTGTLNITGGGSLVISDNGQAARRRAGLRLGRHGTRATVTVSGAGSSHLVSSTGGGAAAPYVLIGNGGDGADDDQQRRSVAVLGTGERDFIVAIRHRLGHPDDDERGHPRRLAIRGRRQRRGRRRHDRPLDREPRRHHLLQRRAAWRRRPCRPRRRGQRRCSRCRTARSSTSTTRSTAPTCSWAAQLARGRNGHAEHVGRLVDQLHRPGGQRVAAGRRRRRHGLHDDGRRQHRQRRRDRRRERRQATPAPTAR